MNLKKVGVIIVMDVLLLAELTWSVYLCSLTPESVSWTFMKSFLPMVLITVIGFRLIMKKLFGYEHDAADLNNSGA